MISLTPGCRATWKLIHTYKRYTPLKDPVKRKTGRTYRAKEKEGRRKGGWLVSINNNNKKNEFKKKAIKNHKLLLRGKSQRFLRLQQGSVSIPHIHSAGYCQHPINTVAYFMFPFIFIKARNVSAIIILRPTRVASSWEQLSGTFYVRV